MHESVLLDEVIDHLNIKPDGRYVDGTLGLGGHAEAILKRLGPKGQLLGLDVDPVTLKQAEDRLQPFGNMAITRRTNFRGLQSVLQNIGWTDVDGMIFDLGTSSPQLEDKTKGLSFQRSEPLDMRLDPTLPRPLIDVLRGMPEDDLYRLFVEFGERRDARRLSRYILHDIHEGTMQTTADLAGLCKRVIRRRGRVHPATRVFLALRCLVNEELEALAEVLNVGPSLLKPGGRIAMISFHSLEDRLVKNMFRSLSRNKQGGRRFSVLFNKPLVPSRKEMSTNPRARSAKLRVLMRH